MIPNTFDYQRASSLDEALGLVGSPGTKVIAGGMSLLPLMKLRLANPERLVDIGRLAELRGVRQLDDGRLAVGALTTYSELADSPAQHYALPRASWLPSFELDETVTPSPVNPLGVKGVGEAGCIAVGAVIASGIEDALAPLGIKHLDMPFTAQTVWRAIQSAKGDRA